MSFWNLSTGETAKSETEYEAPQGGDLSPIPDNTDIMAFIDEAKWDEKDGAEYISLRWRVAKPEGFKNRVIFQKLWVMGNNPNAKDSEKAKKKGDNDKRMLAAIDANAGGELFSIEGKPSSEDIQRCLMNKMMVIKLKVWEMETNTGEKMSGNWICAVSPKSKGVSDAPAPKAPSAPPPPNDMDDEIPF
jgi:hypothetical protein